MTMERYFSVRRLIPSALLLLAVSISGCASVTSGLKQAVVMEYDQRHNFGAFELDEPAPNGNGGVISVVHAKGFWAYFIICTLRNEGDDAQSFTYDAKKFYVDIDGQKHFHATLQSNQWTHQNNIVPSFAEDAFYSETTPTPTTQTFPVGFNASLNYRFAVFIPTGAADSVDPLRLTLRYDGHPNFLTSRNQPATQLSTPSANQLEPLCRPQAQ
jgi:hypothetical protein